MSASDQPLHEKFRARLATAQKERDAVQELRERMLTARLRLKQKRKELRKQRTVARDAQVQLMNELRQICLNARPFDAEQLYGLYEEAAEGPDALGVLEEDYEIAERDYNTLEWMLSEREGELYDSLLDDLLDYEDHPSSPVPLSAPTELNATPKVRLYPPAPPPPPPPPEPFQPLPSGVSLPPLPPPPPPPPMLSYPSFSQHHSTSASSTKPTAGKQKATSEQLKDFHFEEISPFDDASIRDTDDYREKISHDLQHEREDQESEILKSKLQILQVTPRRDSEPIRRQLHRLSPEWEQQEAARPRSENGKDHVGEISSELRARINEWILDSLECSSMEKALAKAQLGKEDLDKETWWNLVKRYWVDPCEYDLGDETENATSLSKEIQASAEQCLDLEDCASDTAEKNSSSERVV